MPRGFMTLEEHTQKALRDIPAPEPVAQPMMPMTTMPYGMPYYPETMPFDAAGFPTGTAPAGYPMFGSVMAPMMSAPMMPASTSTPQV